MYISSTWNLQNEYIYWHACVEATPVLQYITNANLKKTFQNKLINLGNFFLFFKSVSTSKRYIKNFRKISAGYEYIGFKW